MFMRWFYKGPHNVAVNSLLRLCLDVTGWESWRGPRSSDTKEHSKLSLIRINEAKDSLKTQKLKKPKKKGKAIPVTGRGGP
jgi:hypothetical protein